MAQILKYQPSAVLDKRCSDGRFYFMRFGETITLDACWEENERHIGSLKHWNSLLALMTVCDANMQCDLDQRDKTKNLQEFI